MGICGRFIGIVLSNLRSEKLKKLTKEEFAGLMLLPAENKYLTHFPIIIIQYKFYEYKTVYIS